MPCCFGFLFLRLSGTVGLNGGSRCRINEIDNVSETEKKQKMVVFVRASIPDEKVMPRNTGLGFLGFRR